MHITRFTLRDFRNYEVARIEPCDGVNVFTGLNAQGKTNLLEAVYLCCVGRSHRTSRDKELIREGCEAAHVDLTVEKLDGSHDIDIAIPTSGPKRIKVANRQITRSGELMGHLNGVLFSPEDLRMVKDGPSERRRFIDMELSQIRPAYYYALQRYNRALKQRGKLLREIALRHVKPEQLDIWDEQLAHAGDEILRYRQGFIEKLNRTAAEIHLSISGQREHLTIEYLAQPEPEDHAFPDEQALLRALRLAREKDILRGITSVGPHRDDIRLSLDGRDVRAFGSQGQQRTCALSLKLSEMHVMRQETGEWPVLLLDDVMSELDPERRRLLLTAFEDVQVLVTCTDPEDLAGAVCGQIQRVENGHVEALDGADLESPIASDPSTHGGVTDDIEEVLCDG